MLHKDKKENVKHIAFKAGVWYTISSVAIKAIAIITTPIYTRMMSTYDYGVSSAFTSWYSMLLIICSMDLVMSVGRAKQDYSNKLEEYIGSMQVLSGLFTACLIFFSMVFIKPISNLMGMEPMLIIILAVYLFLSPAVTFAQARYRYEYRYKENIGILLFVSLFSVVLTLALILKFNNKYYGKILGTVIPTAVLGIYFWIRNIRKKQLEINKDYWIYALKISLPMLFHSVSLNLLSTSDRVVISKIAGNEDTAIYTLAYQYAILINIIMNSVSQAWQPWFHDNFYAGNRELIRDRSKILVLFGCIVGLGCVALAPEAIYILGPAEYQSGVNVVSPIAIGIVCQFLYSNYINIELHLKNTKFASVGTMFAAAVNIVLNILLIPIYGYVAAAYTTLFSYILLWIIHYSICRFILKVNVYQDAFFLICFLAVVILSLVFRLLWDFVVLRLLLIVGIGIIFLKIIYNSDLEIVLNFKKRIGRMN